MEALIFTLALINGILILATGYYTFTSYIVRKRLDEVSMRQEKIEVLRSVHRQDIDDSLNDMNTLIMDVNTAMERDGYTETAKQARKMESLEKIVENHAKQFALNEASRKEVYENISRISKTLKRFGEDPTLVRGY
tara:strand:+ start:1601 stop:2008 length:408 start_codon:yes stop_codon:yes gene_type:complete